MLCAIYKSKRKPGCYLYISKRDDFSAVTGYINAGFGKPQFLMPFNLRGSKPFVHADKDEVMEKITQQGFYLQMPKQDDGLFNSLSEDQISLLFFLKISKSCFISIFSSKNSFRIDRTFKRRIK